MTIVEPGVMLIGNGEERTEIEAARQLAGWISDDGWGVRIEPIFGPARAGDVPHSRADISVATSQLGYEVAVPFEEGIRRTTEWYRVRIPA